MGGPIVFELLGLPIYVARGGVALGANDDPAVVLQSSMSYLIIRPGGHVIQRDPYTLMKIGKDSYVSELYQDGRWFFPEYTVQLLTPAA